MRLWWHNKVLRHGVVSYVLQRHQNIELWAHDCTCGKKWGTIQGIML